MKYLILLPLVAIISSCCTEKVQNCMVISNSGIQFVGYNPDELDTVFVKTYQAGTNMTVLTDSVIRSANQDFLVIHLETASDVKVEVPATAQTVTFANPKYKTRICEECTSLFGSDKEKLEELESVEINGTRTTNARYEITKP